MNSQQRSGYLELSNVPKDWERHAINNPAYPQISQLTGLEFSKDGGWKAPGMARFAHQSPFCIFLPLPVHDSLLCANSVFAIAKSTFSDGTFALTKIQLLSKGTHNAILTAERLCAAGVSCVRIHDKDADIFKIDFPDGQLPQTVFGLKTVLKGANRGYLHPRIHSGTTFYAGKGSVDEIAAGAAA